MALRRVREGGKYVPGYGDIEEYSDAADGIEAADARESNADSVERDQVQKNNGDWEHNADEPFGEDVERAAGGEAVAEEAVGRGLLCISPIAIEGKRDPEADKSVGDGDAGEDKDAKTRQRDERGVEAGAGGVKGAAAEALESQSEGEHGKSEWEAGCNGAYAENFHAGGHGPVEERRFLQIADAVGVESHPVVAEEHLPGRPRRGRSRRRRAVAG